ncbi:Glycosyltransferase, catalytic subunit of cellulose synthase and poly-beta-1,6-N-acetylglucosamine synthase [Algoriphagus locisalis]|uniref:Glycosyltransferase, catalytic subunit of cellulose synthase and poly-beta-1,6-N-acetylglucosamine synthase n=1 Tax=Algoriphagus locisalis TaxID=305507 RepID=A0A1I6ZVV0_9BACT|nr:glycosyltransferase [Algoriphagus locisalis]SFT66828.1 Glycosyltransferase, catalytic subunit of cellulose synthase and poly-beta-1,6-N-acetylglucosamine synthase [Algoriphagus locisalis]
MIAWIALFVILAQLVIGLLYIQFVVAWVLLRFFWKDHSKPIKEDFPKVSVLIAARNEEKDLPDLLRSFEKLDYPSDRIQFLFADDQSSDATAEILTDWCGRMPNRTFLTVSSSQTGFYNQNGKANALAILEEKATGEYYFFTDADCEVNPNWIREGVSCFSKNVGLLIGITQVKATSLLEKFQEVDWWLTLGFVKVATDMRIQTTGLGNNMVISKEAYEKSGGFKDLPFCLTEDLEISRAIQKSGFKIAHQVSSKMLAITKPEVSFKALLDQRKRWMSGVMTLPVYWKLILAIQVVYFVAAIGLIVLKPSLGLSLALFKSLLQGIFLIGLTSKVRVKINWLYLLVFDFYNFCTTVLTILYYFWPSKTKWKTRVYQ